MVLFEDTRNQIGKHSNIAEYCRNNEITLVRQALYVGDYQLSGQGHISVDTKMSVRELAMDCFQDHERFRSECIRAKEADIQLIVLTEEELPNGCLADWRPPFGKDGLPTAKFKPETLRKVLVRMQEEYGVKFRFCNKRDTGKILMEYLRGERT